MSTAEQLEISMGKFVYALTIQERLDAFKSKNLSVSEDTIMLDDKWFSIKSLVSPDLFLQELEHIDIKKEEFAHALKGFTDEEKNILVEYLEKQEWFNVYKNLMIEFNEVYENEPVVCEQLVLPFKLFAKNKLCNMEGKLQNIKLEIELSERLSNLIVEQLSKLTWKCIIVEITDYKKQSILNGMDGRERYLDFLDICYKSPLQIQSFYGKYPVLGRIITQKMLDLLEALEEMFLNVDTNYMEISNLFGIETNIVENIKVSLGDTHQNGKSVAEIVFDNEKKYVYKPRNSYIEQAFHEMIAYINNNANLKTLFINKVFYAETFTVEQFVEMKPCETIKDVQDYYYRFGMLTVLISLLNGSDMHFENIIAQNAYPCIIDFETLFTQFYFLYNEPDANMKVLKNQTLSLTETGLLPLNFRLDNNGAGIEVSALAGGIPQQISKKHLIPKNVYTDDMCFVYEDSYQISENRNRPMLNGSFQEFKNYKQDIYDGFNDTLDWIYENSNKFKCFIEKTFNNILVRQVMKATILYNNLISYMDHPSYLKDMITFEKLLENSWAYMYKDKRLVKYEIKDLRHLEIPIFYTNTSDTYLKTSNGNYINNYFSMDVLTKVTDKISELTKEMIGKEKIKLQLLLGDYKLLVSNRKNKIVKGAAISNQGIYQEDEVLQACISIAEDIIKDAVTDDKSISWECFDDNSETSKFTFINNGLYSGRAGILLYLYYLNKKIKNDSISRFVDDLLQATKFYKEPIEASAFKGGAGSLYALLKCDAAGNHFKVIQDSIIAINNRNYEMKNGWLDGRAGLIKVVHNINQTAFKGNLSVEAANKIIDSFYNDAGFQEGKRYNPGFGQGVTGALYILLLGQELLKKDYSVEIENLLNLCAEGFNNFEFPLSWDNGIVGFGIGAVACKRYIQDARLDSCANSVIDAMKANDFSDMSLRNGLAGELDFLSSLSLGKNDLLIRQMIVEKRNQIINFYKEHGTVLIEELPQFRNYGLLEGLTGVGYSMLRTLYPDEIPSVLLLD